MSHLDAIIDAPGSKKLLAIDGGGIRGMIAIGFLERMETLLRAALARPDLVLGDYFDYVAGTSTGAIVAVLISLGYTMAQIRSFYQTGAKTMFEPSNAFQRIARNSHGFLAAIMRIAGAFASPAIFTQRALENEIKSVVGADTTLETERLRTLLMLVTRNASTDSHWPLSNNPRAKYNLRTSIDGRAQATNLDIPLWQLVRASTAAPVYFPAEEIHVPGVAKPFMFVDGGITVYNNPAFLLFLMATLPEYGLGWRSGENDLLLVSVGTGGCENANLDLKGSDMNMLYNVQSLPAALIHAATVEQDLLCRIAGRTRADCVVAPLDSEIGTLAGNDVPLSMKLFTYVRYNVELTSPALEELGLGNVDPKDVRKIDGYEHVADLERIGNAAAERCVCAEDFDGFLTLRAGAATSGTSDR